MPAWFRSGPRVFRSALVFSVLASHPSFSHAQAVETEGRGDGIQLISPYVRAIAVPGASPGSPAAVGDTTYIGYTPGRFDAAKNWWSIGAGYSPAASNAPAFRRAPARGGMWDFETATQPAAWASDSLQGWWPIRTLVNGTGGETRPDWNRPWWAVEIGNTANYILNGTMGSAQKRTFGVVGVWHRDGGSGAPASAGATTPAWAPIGGSFSAWMGLRSAADTNAPVDPITGNPFTENVLKWSAVGSASLRGSDNRFPGYGSQMDQMLYRDIDLTGFTGSDLTVAYSYRLRMSTGFGNAAATRTGWFDKDPLQVTGGGATNAAPGNFISSSDAGDAAAPRDSFTVYIGAPVVNSLFLASDGASHPVFDSQRRWFSEVIRVNEGLYRQIDRDTGCVPLAMKSATIPNAVLAPILAASGGKLRLVFRVHTNRGFDDQGSAWHSSNQGAAVLDDVAYSVSGGGGSSPAGWGDFESASAIDNSPTVSPLDAWKSTGKPPAQHPHVHALAGLTYDDLCGQPGDPTRVCNLGGNVVSFGIHDASERLSGQADGTADREMWSNLLSPTIQLRSGDGAWPNPIGLVNPSAGDDPQDPVASEEYYLDADLYLGVFDPFTKGALWRAGIQSYPARDRNSPANKVWGNVRYLPYALFNPDQFCVRDFVDHGVARNGMLVWDAAVSESPDHPDSVVIAFGIRQECYRFGVSIGCASPDGAYFDNISFMIVDGVPVPIGASIWDLYQDAFPQNETAGLPAYAAKFDTCTALVKSGINIAPAGGLMRFDVPGDSAAVTSRPGAGGIRIDLVFRILPGPGNYVVIGRPDLGTLAKDPASSGAGRVAVVATPNSTNFWESYLANNGPKGTPGGHGGSTWNPNVWNSARCDTSEISGLFAYQSRGMLGGPASDLAYDTRLHEQEIGIAGDAFGAAINIRGGLTVIRHRCFVAAAGASTSDIDCVHDVGTSGTGYNLTYLSTAAGTSNPATGYDGSSYDVGSGVVPNGSYTVEGSKVIPDGLLTPGSSVQYFFRRETGANPGVPAGMTPDTSLVYPQHGEASFDAHRWQYFGVLPDRWKSASYRHPVLGYAGTGEACLLVIDSNDRRGDERRWVGVADTLGDTRASKYGAQNGWHAAGGQNLNDPAARIAANLGIPGTTWDLYNVKASESLAIGAGSIGGRFAYRNPANPQIDNRNARLGPTPEMMDAFYRIVFLLSGDLNSGVLGPYLNRTQDDVRLLKEWLFSGDPLSPGRGFHAMGDGFVESNFNEGPGSDQDLFNVDYLGLTLRNNTYVMESGNTEATPDLIVSAALASPASSDIFAIQSVCLWTNDVLERTAELIAQTSDLTKYEDAGPGPYPLTSTVGKAWTSIAPWISIVDGFDILNLRGLSVYQRCGNSRYFFEEYTNVFGGICPTVGTPFSCWGDIQTREDSDFVDAPRNNPLHRGVTTIAFGLSTAGLVETRIFDVAGRQVRMLTRRGFPAGEHTLAWDGTNDSGHPLPRGVYFAKIRFVDRGVESARRIVVLK